MLEARDLYEAELARCRATLDAVGWLSATVAETHLRCTECGSDLVEQRDPSNSDQATMDLFCQGCGAALDVEAQIVEAVDRALSGEAYDRFKDAGESGPVFDCPECSHATYIDTENACANCGANLSGRRNVRGATPRFLSKMCVFHGIVGADSTGSWARFPRDGGHGFHGIVGAPAEGLMEPRLTV